MLALLFLLAQAVPAPAPDEGPREVEARVRYERAIRAEFDGRTGDALREAQACIEIEPAGRFADASRSLIGRLHVGGGPRSELVITSTLTGLYLSALVAGAANADTKGTTALLMAGTGVALAGSIFATSGRAVPPSMPQMLENGVGYGTFAGLVGQAIARDRVEAGPVAALAAGGALGGLLASPYLSGGDAGAMTASMIYGGSLPTAILYIASGDKNAAKTYEWTALIGSSAGIFLGPVLNSQLHWSRARWNVVTLGGGVGALMGGGLAILTDATGQGATALAAGGAVAGLLLTGWMTHDFTSEDQQSASLLHFEGGKVSAGNPAAALSLAEKTATLRLVDGRF